MKNIFKLGSAAIASACLFSQPVVAHSFDPKEVNGEIVGAALTKLGYRAQITTDGVGDPMVKTTMGGVNVNILFYNCNEAQTACEDIRFSAGFDLADGLSPEAVADWNESELYGTAYLDDENDPFVKVILQAGPGGTPELIEGYISTVETVLDRFKDHIGFNN